MQKILQAFLSFDQNTTAIASRFQEFLEYNDINYHTMKIILFVLKNKQEKVNVIIIIILFNRN